MPGEMPFCKISWKRTCFVKYAWWNAVLQKEAEREHALSNFVKYAWWNAVLKKKAERKHALSFLSSMPGEMPLKHVLFQLAFAKRHFTRPTWQKWQSMFSFSLLLQKGISLGLLDKHVLFQLVFANWHSIRYAWQSMFSFSFVVENGFSPGILDKARSLSACFCKTAFH